MAVGCIRQTASYDLVEEIALTRETVYSLLLNKTSRIVYHQDFNQLEYRLKRSESLTELCSAQADKMFCCRVTTSDLDRVAKAISTHEDARLAAVAYNEIMRIQPFSTFAADEAYTRMMDYENKRLPL